MKGRPIGLRARLRSALPPALLVGLAAGGAVAAPPLAGRYAATLCVAAAAQPRSCGPADVEVGSGGRVDVQVSDIVYRLRVRSGQAAVVVTHGAMQIDEFDAGAEWTGASLRFDDAEKQVRYEVEIGAPRHGAR